MEHCQFFLARRLPRHVLGGALRRKLRGKLSIRIYSAIALSALSAPSALLATMLLAVSASAQSVPRPLTPLYRVEGHAYDSLARQPLSGAFVAVEGSGRSTTSDDKGRFRLDSIPEGTHIFTLQHAKFDSVGLSGVSVRVVVQRNMPRVVLAVPAFETLWRAACGDIAVPRDSVLVYGSVREAERGAVQANAKVDAAWTDLVGGGKSLTSIGQRRWHRTSVTNERGEFALCGIPARTPFTLQAALGAPDTLAVTSIDMEPSSIRVLRVELLVGQPSISIGVEETDSAGNAQRDTLPRATTPRDSAPNTAIANPNTGNGPIGAITGIVTNAAGTPLANAAIAVDSLTEVRTSDDGRFTVRGVPAGTRRVSVIAIGMQPFFGPVNLMAGDTVHMTIPMVSVQRLEAVNVKATVVSMRIRSYNERRRSGFGSFRDSSEIKSYPNISAVLYTIPNVRPGTGRGLENLNMGGCIGEDAIDVRLDGHPSMLSIVSQLDPRDIAAIEAYLRRLSMPTEVMSRKPCVLWIWTKRGFGGR